MNAVARQDYVRHLTELVARVVKPVKAAQAADPHSGQFYVPLDDQRITDPAAVKRALMSRDLPGLVLRSLDKDGVGNVVGISVNAPGFAVSVTRRIALPA
jgi:hypothetical protein